MNKKLVSAALTATTLMWAFGAVVLPVAKADTASTQAQIQALLAQIAQLQAQIGTSSTTTGTTTSGYSFTKDLTLGSKGADVTALQQLLITKGFLTAVTAPTGYFGALSQAALGKFQAANGITPAAGYFGPKTRAFVNSMTVSTTTTTTTTGGYPTGCTSASGYSPTTGQSCATTTTGTTPVVAPATGVAVSLSTSNPATGSLISGSTGAARVPVLAVNFTAGNAAGVTVSEVKFHKVGVLSDSSISGAYLTQNGKVLYQYNSLSQGVLDFSGMSLSVPAGQTVTLFLAIDVSGGLSAGNTTSFSMNAASDVVAFDASNSALTASGMFPLNGNTFTVTTVSNPDLAKVTVTSGAIGGTVTAGSQNNLVYASTFQVNNSKVYLKGLNFHVIGSANKGDIRNVKLVVNGQQVGTTLSTVGQDGTAYFDASANPGTLNTGNNNVQVFADVMGSPSYDFTFEILNSYDILAVDSQYGIPVTTGSDSGTKVTIQQGQITVSQDSATPSGSSISKGQSGMVLAKFDIYAAGEAVKVKWLPFSLSFGGTTTTLSNFVQNISIVDDAGGQVGSTINIPGSTSDTNGSYVTSTNPSVYTGSFGSSASPINYTIPANTTRVLSLKADIQSGANFSTIQAALLAPSALSNGNLNGNNLQGMISSKLGATSGASGNSLTLSASSLTVTQDSSLGAQTLSTNSINQKIGSYAFTASQAEGVTISNLSVGTNAAANTISNLKVMVNGTQFGSSQPTVGSSTYSFSGTPFTVPSGSTVVVGVYADVLSNSGSVVTNVSGLSGTGSVSYSSISLPGTVTGQTLTISSTGSTVTASINTSNQPSNGQLSMGMTGNILAALSFNETANVEDVKLTSLALVDVSASASNTKPSFSNLTLWNGAQEVGSVQSYTATTTVGTTTAPAFLYSFTSLLNNAAGTAYIPRGGVLNLTLKGDVNSFTSGGAADVSSHVFEIATSTATGFTTTSTVVVAQGATSGKSAAITLPAVSTTDGTIAGVTTQTVLRNAIAFSSTAVGSASNRGKSTNDEIADLTFSASNAGSLLLDNATITFQGSAASSTTFLAGVKLLDSNGNAITVASTSPACTGANTCLVGFNFGGRQITGSQTFKLTVDGSKELAASGNSSVSLYATIATSTDVTYTDATDGTGTKVSLPTIMQPGNMIFPLNLNSVTYASGI